MEGKDYKKEKSKGFKELKKFGAEKLLKIASNKLFIDIRKVRRFRIWQGEYLNHVMHGISIKDNEKQLNLKRKYIQFLIFLLSKHLQKAIMKWSSNVKLFKLCTLPNSKFLSAVKLIAIVLRFESKNMANKQFPLFYLKSNNWKTTRLKVALSNWKGKVVKCLLDESHKEMAIIKINHFLHKKTTPLTNFAVKKICLRIGAKIGCSVLVVALKSLIFQRKHVVFRVLSRKNEDFMQKSKFTREKRTKFLMLQKFAAIKQLTIISNKKHRQDPLKLKLFFAFMRWKKLKKRLRIGKVMHKLKGPSRKIKQLALKYLEFKATTLNKFFARSALMRWKKNSVKVPQFAIDKNVYCNQAQVAAYIEGQIHLKSLQIKKIAKAIKIQNLDYIVKKKLRNAFAEWNTLMLKERNKGREEDVLFEYIHFLEDNLGVPHKFSAE